MVSERNSPLDHGSKHREARARSTPGIRSRLPLFMRTERCRISYSALRHERSQWGVGFRSDLPDIPSKPKEGSPDRTRRPRSQDRARLRQTFLSNELRIHDDTVTVFSRSDTTPTPRAPSKLDATARPAARKMRPQSARRPQDVHDGDTELPQLAHALPTVGIHPRPTRPQSARTPGERAPHWRSPSSGTIARLLPSDESARGEADGGSSRHVPRPPSNPSCTARSPSAARSGGSTRTASACAKHSRDTRMQSAGLCGYIGLTMGCSFETRTRHWRAAESFVAMGLRRLH